MCVQAGPIALALGRTSKCSSVAVIATGIKYEFHIYFSFGIEKIRFSFPKMETSLCHSQVVVAQACTFLTLNFEGGCLVCC